MIRCKEAREGAGSLGGEWSMKRVHLRSLGPEYVRLSISSKILETKLAFNKYKRKKAASWTGEGNDLYHLSETGFISLATCPKDSIYVQFTELTPRNRLFLDELVKKVLILYRHREKVYYRIYESSPSVTTIRKISSIFIHWKSVNCYETLKEFKPFKKYL
jgi:hypothetical protein